MKKLALFLAPVMLVALCLAGCGGVSEDKPIDQVRSEAQSMTAKDLQVMMDKYKSAIEAKKGDLAKIQGKISKIPINELMGQEAKALKSDVDDVSRSMRALMDRLNIYMQELSRK